MFKNYKQAAKQAQDLADLTGNRYFIYEVKSGGLFLVSADEPNKMANYIPQGGIDPR